MNRHHLFPLFALPLSLAACGTPMMIVEDKPDTTCDTAPAMVTLAQLQTEIFDVKCKTCHYPAMGGMMAGSGFSYGDYSTAAKTAEMINKNSLFAGAPGTLKVVDQMAGTTAEKLANSSLWLKVSTIKTTGFKGPKGEASGSRMPNDGTPFSAAEVKKIKDWICRGSPM